MIGIDSNMLVAALVDTHPHHETSAKFLVAADTAKHLIAAHSIAETYAVLTRRTLPFHLNGAVAMGQIEPVAARFTIVSLTAVQTLDAVRRFSRLGAGPRLYDFLIGAAGEAHGVDTIVTWNTRVFEGLFPALRIVTPEAFLPPPPPS